tara:strand:- start:1330 stop:2244 length:915 start_codon:yes stop_codon:yes gene_type:complete
MVMIKDENGIERFSLTSDLCDLIEQIKKKINEDDSQFLGIIWGDVGSGKSLWAQHFGYAIDPTITEDRICFDKTELIDAIIKYRNKVIIADEGIAIFFSRASMTKEGRLVSELMAQIRQKNLCILVCVPEILTMDWTILKAANMAVYVWENKKEINGRKVTIKGNAAVYPEIPGHPFKSHIVNFLKRKKNNPYAKIYRPTPWITCPGNPKGETFKDPWYPIGEEVYREKKEAVLKKYINKKDSKLNKTDIRQEAQIEFIRRIIGKNPNKSDSELAEMVGYSRQRVAQLRILASSANSEQDIKII